MSIKKEIMKHLKTYESFEENSEFLLDIKDILVELEDDGFDIEYLFNIDSFITILISKGNEFFYLDEELEYSILRLCRYLDMDLSGIYYGYSIRRPLNVLREKGIFLRTTRGNLRLGKSKHKIDKIRLDIPIKKP